MNNRRNRSIRRMLISRLDMLWRLLMWDHFSPTSPSIPPQPPSPDDSPSNDTSILSPTEMLNQAIEIRNTRTQKLYSVRLSTIPPETLKTDVDVARAYLLTVLESPRLFFHEVFHDNCRIALTTLLNQLPQERRRALAAQARVASEQFELDMVHDKSLLMALEKDELRAPSLSDILTEA